jgi:hypothetical protein
MEIKFTPVRIGNFRKNLSQERVIYENYIALKYELKEFVNSIQNKPNLDTIEVDIVIPATGSRITFTLDAIRDSEVKQLFINNFPNSIYKGDYLILSANCMNFPFFPHNVKNVSA